MTSLLRWIWPPVNPLRHLDPEDLTNRLANKKILIVGGTAGIGKQLAVACMARQAQVTIVGRRQPEAELLTKLRFISMDLTLMRTARTLGNQVDFSSLDVIVFTNGILSTAERKVTEEGLELDLAVSFLSRLAALKPHLAQLKPSCRIFVMGFPGKPNNATVGDLNSERLYQQWPAHMNTVVGNEALVHWLAQEKGIQAFGLNPGLITSEIRSNALGTGWLSYMVESLIYFFFQSAQQYAENVLVHLMVTPDLDDKKDILFESDGSVLPTNPFLLKDDHQAAIMKESEALLDRALKAEVPKK